MNIHGLPPPPSRPASQAFSGPSFTLPARNLPERIKDHLRNARTATIAFKDATISAAQSAKTAAVEMLPTRDKIKLTVATVVGGLAGAVMREAISGVKDGTDSFVYPPPARNVPLLLLSTMAGAVLAGVAWGSIRSGPETPAEVVARHQADSLALPDDHLGDSIALPEELRVPVEAARTTIRGNLTQRTVKTIEEDIYQPAKKPEQDGAKEAIHSASDKDISVYLRIEERDIDLDEYLESLGTPEENGIEPQDEGVESE